MNYTLIKDLAERKKMSLVQVLKKAGISSGGYYQAVNNNSLKVRVLEDIARVLRVSPCLFFEAEGEYSSLDNPKASYGQVIEIQRQLELNQVELEVANKRNEYLESENEYLRKKLEELKR